MDKTSSHVREGLSLVAARPCPSPRDAFLCKGVQLCEVQVLNYGPHLNSRDLRRAAAIAFQFSCTWTAFHLRYASSHLRREGSSAGLLADGTRAYQDDA